MNFDPRLIAELRKLAASHESPCSLARLVADRQGLSPDKARLTVISYFREAFHLSLADAMQIGAAPIFPGENRSASEVDAELLRLFETTRDTWRTG